MEQTVQEQGERMRVRRAIRHAGRLADAHDAIQDVIDDFPTGVEGKAGLREAMERIDFAICGLEDVSHS